MQGTKNWYPCAKPNRKDVRTQDGASKTAGQGQEPCQPAQAKGLESLSRATDTLSTMLAQEVKELNVRQKAQRGDGSDPALMKGLKEATAVLKDLAAVAKTLNDQGADAEARACGVVLLPAVEDV